MHCLGERIPHLRDERQLVGERLPLGQISRKFWCRDATRRAVQSALHRISFRDQFAGILFYFGLFLFLVISVKLFKSRVPFVAGWWAVSFPLAALVNAALEYATYAQAWPIMLLAAALLVFLSIVIIVLAVKTLQILANGKLLSA